MSAVARTSTVRRETAETKISLTVNLDGTGQAKVETGVPFLDHMLVLLAKHACLDLVVEARGDVAVDYHHTVEDTGIVLGQAIREALGDKAGIRRYGFFILPMDEALARVALDLIAGQDTERTRLDLVRRKPIPFPPEPLRYPVVQATRAALAREDATGRRGADLRTLDHFGIGFNS
jgi:imidazoleglycerol phosphate dehydratase HisB